MTDLSWQVVLLIGLVAIVGAYVQAVVGLGLGMLTAPVVALVAPSFVPVLPLWLALLISGLNLLGEHEHVDWRSTAWSLPAREAVRAITLILATFLGSAVAFSFGFRLTALFFLFLVLISVSMMNRRCWN